MKEAIVLKAKILGLLGVDKSSLESLLFLNRLDKTIIPLFFSQSVLSAILAYTELYFLAKIIDAVIGGNFESLKVLIIVFIVTAFVLGISADFVQNLNEYKADKIQRKMVGLIQEKIMTMDYAKMENTYMLKKISDAVYSMEHMGGYYSYLLYFRQLLEAWIKVIASGIIVIHMCFLVSVSDHSVFNFLSSAFVSLALLIGFAMANVLISQILAKKSKTSSSEVFKQKAIVERRLNYFTDKIFLNYATGKDIRIFGIAQLLLDHHKKNMKEAEKFFRIFYFKKAQNYDTLNQLTDSVLAYVSYIVVVLKVLSGSITIGALSGYVGVISLFNASMTDIITAQQKIKLQKEYTEAFKDILSMESKSELSLSSQNTIQTEESSAYEFQFHNVYFRYNDSEDYILKNISCRFSSGKKLAIVGKNGAGKTTLIKLLCRLYEPTKGHITLNGIHINSYDYNEYISLISVVFQDYSLFAFPLKENVAASKSADTHKVIQSLETAGFGSRLREMPQGIQTNLYHYDDDGVEISGGEAQKIAIARALYKDAQIIILDEPTAALDPISEYETYKNFNLLSKNKTTIYISHRMSSCRFCDNIIVMDKGEIIQEGSHAELIQDEENLYALLYHTQAKHYS